MAQFPAGQWTSYYEWMQSMHPGVAPGSEGYLTPFPEFETWQTSQGYPTAASQVTTPTPTTPTPTTTPTTPAMPTVPPITVPTIAMPPAPTPPTLPPVPKLTPPTLPPVPTLETPTMPEVPTVPPYEKSPEQIAWEEEYGVDLKEWREAGGYGIPEDIQTKMIQKETDILKAREAENIRVMKNNMERREITNSGFVFANEQTIKSNTTVAIANNIRDVQISSALMKMASFEKAMGASAQFIGYLANESLKAYAPKLAQWEKEAQYRLTEYGVEASYGMAKADLEASYGLAGYEMAGRYGLSQAELEARYGLTEYGVAAEYGMAGYQAKVQGAIAQFNVNALAIMTEWQGKFDLMKMEINQAYAQDNINLANQWTQTLQDDQQTYGEMMAQMEIDHADAVAQEEAGGTISGSIVNGIFAVAAAFLG